MGQWERKENGCWSFSSPRAHPQHHALLEQPQRLGASFPSLLPVMLLHQNTVPSDALAAVVRQVPGNPPLGNTVSTT